MEHPTNMIDNGPFLPRFELVSQSSTLSWLAYIVEIIAIDIKEELVSPNKYFNFMGSKSFCWHRLIVQGYCRIFKAVKLT